MSGEMPRASGSAIEVRAVSKSFASGVGAVDVLTDISLTIPAGSLFAILGMSGSGKTTLLNIIGGLEVPTSGSVDVFGTRVSAMDAAARTRFRREKVGFVFQFYNLLPTLTAAENIRVGLEMLGLAPSEMAARTAEYLAAVELSDKADRFPSQLSGGEQQRVAIARALAKRPLLVLADEPTGNLDRATGHSITNLMRRLTSDLGTTFVVVTHDPGFGNIADNSYYVGAEPPKSDARLREVS